MKYILNPSKPSLGFVFLVCLLSIVVIIATGSYFLIKFFLLLALIYLIDNSVIALIENKGIYQIHKGYLFKQKKNNRNRQGEGNKTVHV